MKKASPVPIALEHIEGSAHGYYHLAEKRIAIDDDMSELQTLKTAIHEIAHAKLHDIDLNAPKEEKKKDLISVPVRLRRKASPIPYAGTTDLIHPTILSDMLQAGAAERNYPN